MMTIVHINYRQAFECSGRDAHICHGCKLRFQCLTEATEISILPDTIKKFKINDLSSAVKYMFGEGIIKYEIMQVKIND
jgi:hypothetical protein